VDDGGAERYAGTAGGFGWSLTGADQVGGQAFKVMGELGVHLGFKLVAMDHGAKPRLWLFDDAGED
jgi:hypothetical protein